MNCPFCPIQKKTEWYLHDTVNQVVACEDLEPRGYKYRILVVGSGSRWHRHWKLYSKGERDFLIGLAKFVAQHHIKIGKAKRLVGIDTEHFKISSHGHCQALMK